MSNQCAHCSAANPPENTVCFQCGQPLAQAQNVSPYGAAPAYGPPPGAPYGYAAPPAPHPTFAGAELGSVGRRIGAWILDLVIFGAATNVVFAILGLGSSAGLASGPQAVAELVAFFVYFAVPTALRGQTVAKIALGLKVVREDNGQVPGWGPAFGRYGLLILMNLPCYIPAIVCACLMGKDPKIQGWHDKAAHTVVIRTR